MNGVHDMGGMHGMGPVEHENNEPVFHAPWEGRVFAMNVAMGFWRKWNIDASRHGVEQIPPADYLRMSYYEKWFTRLVGLLLKSGLITQGEFASGRPEGAKQTPPFTAAKAVETLGKGGPYTRNVAVAPRFQVGQRVRARNLNPAGHTRLPRYVRGRAGAVHRDHGVFVFPDTNAQFLGEKPQHLYSVRFAARELWGEEASPRDSVYLDLWDDYLEPA
ncbi:MAG TPA: nitrile hydratase subunit beta [Bryobacteraceae bacterium]|nr:nitrile hydratase subunit beta [Bryobacteraceae bacterium]